MSDPMSPPTLILNPEPGSHPVSFQVGDMKNHDFAAETVGGTHDHG